MQGKDPGHQLELIIRIFGSPSDEDLAFVRNDKARRHITGMGQRQPQDLEAMFPDATPDALDLLRVCSSLASGYTVYVILPV